LLQLWIVQKTPCFMSCYDSVEKHPIFGRTIDQVIANAHAIITLVLCYDTWNTLLGNTRHVQVIKQNSVWKYHGWSLLPLMLRLHLPFGRGWQEPTLQLLRSWVQFWLFLANWYAHHLPNCLSPVQSICAT
jgi:hypothetical protein